MEMSDGYTHKHNDLFVVTKRAHQKVILLQTSIYMRKKRIQTNPATDAGFEALLYIWNTSWQPLSDSWRSDKMSVNEVMIMRSVIQNQLYRLKIMTCLLNRNFLS